MQTDKKTEKANSKHTIGNRNCEPLMLINKTPVMTFFI